MLNQEKKQPFHTGLQQIPATSMSPFSRSILNLNGGGSDNDASSLLHMIFQTQRSEIVVFSHSSK